MHWGVTHKADQRCVRLADRHYSRQTKGSTMFTRPGYNMVLYTSDDKGEAVFVWWRPKWEENKPALQRFDKLQAIECTIFRNETSILSSLLIQEAVSCVKTWNRYIEPLPDGLITGINSTATTKQRSKNSQPGQCFIHAGWQPLEHAKGVADYWLHYTFTQLTLIDPIEPAKLPYHYERRPTIYDKMRAKGVTW